MGDHVIMSLKIVIEIEDPDSDAQLRHQLANVQEKITDGVEDGWAGLETAFKYFQVTRIVGVVLGSGVHGANGTKVVTVGQFEGNAEVKL